MHEDVGETSTVLLLREGWMDAAPTPPMLASYRRHLPFPSQHPIQITQEHNQGWLGFIEAINSIHNKEIVGCSPKHKDVYVFMAIKLMT